METEHGYSEGPNSYVLNSYVLNSSVLNSSILNSREFA